MEERTEGYLYTFGATKSGGIYCVLTFCVLSAQRFAQLRHKGDLVTLRNGVLDSDHRVEDTGRQVVNGKVLYTLRLYNVCDYSKEVLLGSPSAEEACEWMNAFLCSLGKPVVSLLDSWSAPETTSSITRTVMSNQKSTTRRLMSASKVVPIVEVDELSPLPLLPVPKWRLTHCENGLRFFEEISSTSKIPVVKAVGVVKGRAELIFDEIMNYGPGRFHWDHTVETASIVEIVDGHSDVIHVCLKKDWAWLRPRDFCISRYWKREENGAYTIFYRSVAKFPYEPGHVRATIHSGGYMITPLKVSKCLVESVFEIDVGGWTATVGLSYSAHLRRNLLSLIAGIREYFAAHRMDSISSDMRPIQMEAGKDALIEEAATTVATQATSTPFLESDMEDFYDARADQLSDTDSHSDILEVRPRTDKDGSVTSLRRQASFSGTLPWGTGGNSICETESTVFNLRGKRFFTEATLVPAEESFFKLVAGDWVRSDEKLDNISSHRLQKEPGDLFYFTFNLQVPQSGSYYNLVFYFATSVKILEGSLLHQFIHKDDEFRNERLLLLPGVPEGSWIVRQAVGSRAVAVGRVLECSYHKGANYIEVDCNMGAAGIVRGVMGIVFSYMSALVVDMGFTLRAVSDDELPEELLGGARCTRLEVTAAVEPSFIL